MTAFLASQAGLAVTIMAVITALIGSFAALHQLRHEPSLKHAARTDRVRSREAIAGLIPPFIGALVMVVPLVFTIALRDVFVLPKVVVLEAALPLAAVAYLVGRREPRRPTSRSPWGRAIDLSLLGLVAWSGLATALSISPVSSLVGQADQYQGFLTLLLYAAFFIIARASFSADRDLETLQVAAATGGGLVGAYAVAQRLGLDPLWKSLPYGHSVSTIGQAEWLASFLVLCAPLALTLALRSRGLSRMVVVAALGSTIAGILFSLSRGGYLGLVAAAVVLAAGSRTRPRQRWLVAVPVLAAVMLGVVVLRPVRAEIDTILRRAISTTDLSDGSIADRLAMWRVGADVAIDHPLIGTGPDTFPLVFPAYRDRLLADRRDFWLHYRVESPHDVYLQVADGAGLPAAAAYLAFVTASLAMIRRSAIAGLQRPSSMLLWAVLAAGIGHLVTDAFQTADITSSWFAWLLMGAGVGVAESQVRSPSLELAYAKRA